VVSSILVVVDIDRQQDWCTAIRQNDLGVQTDRRRTIKNDFAVLNDLPTILIMRNDARLLDTAPN